MTLKINAVKLARRLAHKKLQDNWNELEDMYVENYDEYVGLKYSKEAQKRFDINYKIFLHSFIDNIIYSYF